MQPQHLLGVNDNPYKEQSHQPAQQDDAKSAL